MKTYQIIDPCPSTGGTKNIMSPVKGDFIYAQPSGVSTIHRSHNTDSKSDIVAVVPANLLILEV